MQQKTSGLCVFESERSSPKYLWVCLIGRVLYLGQESSFRTREEDECQNISSRPAPTFGHVCQQEWSPPGDHIQGHSEASGSEDVPNLSGQDQRHWGHQVDGRSAWEIETEPGSWTPGSAARKRSQFFLGGYISSPVCLWLMNVYTSYSNHGKFDFQGCRDNWSRCFARD